MDAVQSKGSGIIVAGCDRIFAPLELGRPASLPNFAPRFRPSSSEPAHRHALAPSRDHYHLCVLGRRNLQCLGFI